jgi:hypothetical protein
MQDLFYVKGKKPEEILKGRKPEEVPPEEKFDMFTFVKEVSGEIVEPTKEELGY